MSNDFFVDRAESAGEPPRGASLQFLRSPWLAFVIVLILFLLIWPAW